MTIRRKLRSVLNRHDPYGMMQVSAAQITFVTISLFLINFIFSIPDFNTIFFLPAFGLITIGTDHSFDLRIRHLAIFCLITVIYAVLLSIVQSYQYLIILIVGIAIFTLYIISKKYRYPPLMVPLIHVSAYTFFIFPFGGDWSHIYVFFIDSLMITALTIALMSVFPRIYFFRVWLRSLQFSVQELEHQIHTIIANQAKHGQLAHLIAMEGFTYALSYKEYGFAARKITLRFMSFYEFIMAVLCHYQPITTLELLELANVLSRLYHAIPSYQPLETITFTPNTNDQVLTIQKKTRSLVMEWNRLCQKR